MWFHPLAEEMASLRADGKGSLLLRQHLAGAEHGGVSSEDRGHSRPSKHGTAGLTSDFENIMYSTSNTYTYTDGDHVVMTKLDSLLSVADYTAA